MVRSLSLVYVFSGRMETTHALHSIIIFGENFLSLFHVEKDEKQHTNTAAVDFTI